MTCDELRDVYELYALGVLEQAERDELDEHLRRGCPACSAGLKRALETNAIIMNLAPETAPPRNLRKKVLAAVGVEKTAWNWIVGWAAVTAGLLVAVLWLSVQDRRRVAELAQARTQIQTIAASSQQNSAELARLQAAVALLNEPDTRLIGVGRGVPLPPKARVFVNPQRGVLFLANNLQPAPAGRIYEMWVIPKGGAPRPAGLFQSDASGTALHLQSGPVDIGATTAVAVTLEPESGSAAPTTTPIIVVAL